jgi:hypothetical protein
VDFVLEFGRIQPAAGPGYPLQFLNPPAAGFRYFRFYPLRFAGRRVPRVNLGALCGFS